MLPSTAPAPGYNSNNAGRNTFPNQQFVPHQETTEPMRDMFDEASVGSDFEATRSDINFEPEPFQRDRDHGSDDEYGYQGHEVDAARPEEHAQYANERNSLYFQPHKLNHKHSQSPMIPAKNEQATPKKQMGISGRFETLTIPPFQSQNADLQLRPSHGGSVEDQVNGKSKKRGRSSQPIFENQLDLQPGEPPLLEEDELPRHSASADNDQYIQSRDQGSAQNRFDIPSDEAGSTTDGESPSRQPKSRSDRLQQGSLMNPAYLTDSRLGPDFDDDALRGMTYAQLNRQSWEDVPISPQPALALPMELQGREVSLDERIEYYSTKGEDNALLEFYGSMSKSEWEQAGDFLLDKFGDVLKKIKEARRAKRDMVAQFEAEIEAREMAVRCKSEIFEKEFKEMKTSGENVLRGKLG